MSACIVSDKDPATQRVWLWASHGNLPYWKTTIESAEYELVFTVDHWSLRKYHPRIEADWSLKAAGDVDEAFAEAERYLIATVVEQPIIGRDGLPKVVKRALVLQSQDGKVLARQVFNQWSGCSRMMAHRRVREAAERLGVELQNYGCSS